MRYRCCHGHTERTPRQSKYKLPVDCTAPTALYKAYYITLSEVVDQERYSSPASASYLWLERDRAPTMHPEFITVFTSSALFGKRFAHCTSAWVSWNTCRNIPGHLFPRYLLVHFEQSYKHITCPNMHSADYYSNVRVNPNQ